MNHEPNVAKGVKLLVNILSSDFVDPVMSEAEALEDQIWETIQDVLKDTSEIINSHQMSRKIIDTWYKGECFTGVRIPQHILRSILVDLVTFFNKYTLEEWGNWELYDEDEMILLADLRTLPYGETA